MDGGRAGRFTFRLRGRSLPAAPGPYRVVFVSTRSHGRLRRGVLSKSRASYGSRTVSSEDQRPEDRGYLRSRHCAALSRNPDDSLIRHDHHPAGPLELRNL